jgi:8-oxo-dGTP diphosphatase
MPKVVEVAVGILLKEQQGQLFYLLGKRPSGKPYEGYWEFPGGKIESGETVDMALSRELQEELGIQIHCSTKLEELMVLEHDYPHAYVRLHVLIVKGWDGEPTGLEQQELYWQSLSEPNLKTQILLPAALPMIEALKTKIGRKLI